MTQIPIYRAEVINIGRMNEHQMKDLIEISGRYYAIGYYTYEHLTKEHFIEINSSNYAHIVNEKTLAISFPDMLDKNKKRIFASLSEDGVGGDIFYDDWDNAEGKVIIINGCACVVTDHEVNESLASRMVRNERSFIEVFGIFHG